MKLKFTLVGILSAVLLISGCNRQTVLADADLLGADAFSKRDYLAEYDESACAHILLNGDTASCDSDAVEITGGIITILDEGVYTLSGTLTDGMIIVDADKTDKLQLVLNGADITCADSAAIYVRQADKVFITLADGTGNHLANGGAFTAIDDNGIDGAIFSRDDLTLNGSGALTIESPAGHGVVSKDSLKLTGGEYAITASGHALSGKDEVCIDGPTLNLVSGKDGVHAENVDDASLGNLYIASGDLIIQAEGDGLSASGALQIDGGRFIIVCGGGSADVSLERADGFHGGFMNDPRSQFSPMDDGNSVSAKGIKSDGEILLRGGEFSIDTADDAMHANGALTISNGSFEISCGDDGIHSDGLLTVSGGSIQISKCYEGLEGLCIAVTGGDISLTAADDGLNAAGGSSSIGFGGSRGGDPSSADQSCDVTISGGNLYVNAGGDAIDSNGTLNISGGTTVLSSPVSGDTSTLDYGLDGSVTGGVFIATGASSMSMGFGESSTQGSIMLRTEVYPANTEIVLADAEGSVLLTHTADQEFSCVTISCPGIVLDGVYTLTIGDQDTEIVMDRLTYGSDLGFGGFNRQGNPGGMGGKPGWREDEPPRR